MSLTAERFKGMQGRDWAFLAALSLLVSSCGVFGVSYVMGEGWPVLYLWAEIVLSLVLAPVVGWLLVMADVGFAKGVLRSQPAADGSPREERRARIRRVFDVLTPNWSPGSIAIFTLVMAILWSPWYVANFPGGTYWDTYYQMFQIYPENHPIAIIPWAEIYNKTLTDAWLVDHHPVFTTIVYGAFGWASDQLTGNWMAGVAAFCIIQGLAHCVAFTASVAYLRKVGCPPALNFVAYAFFAIMPFVSTWALCMVKDSFFGLFHIPYFMIVFDTLRTEGRTMRRPRNAILFALCALMLCLTKKTGIFVVAATAVVGAVSFRREKVALEAYIAQGLLSAIIVLVMFPLLLFPAFNIQAGGAQETYGPLFQQTARYVHDYGDEVTPEEKEAISKVLDYKRLSDQYFFDFEDSIKYRYNLDATKADMAGYLKVYVSQGLKHPDAYFGALISLAGFYVAPTAFANIRMVTVDTHMGDDDRYMLWNPDELDWLRLGLDEAYRAIGETPVVDLPLLLVTYVFWLPALLAFIAFRNRLKCWTLFVPPLVLLAFCAIAPVYDARYAVPIFDAAPLFFCGVFVLLKERQCAKGPNLIVQWSNQPLEDPMTDEKKPLVGIIMGSKSDMPVMEACMQQLDEFNIPYEVKVASAHRTPDIVHEWAQNADLRGMRVIIAAAGKAAHLGGVVAAYTPLPVIAVPMKTSDLGGLDSLLSMVQMPSGVPVATVAINGAKNAAILATQIIGAGTQEVVCDENACRPADSQAHSARQCIIDMKAAMAEA